MDLLLKSEPIGHGGRIYKDDGRHKVALAIGHFSMSLSYLPNAGFCGMRQPKAQRDSEVQLRAKIKLGLIP